jgi:hypothetical protein
MHQDIKTFFDITAIDLRNQITVDLRLQKHGYTVSDITLNGNMVYWDNYISHWDLFSAVDLVVDLKEFTEGVSGIEIGLIINGLEILPKYQHLASKSTNYIDKLGIWELHIPSNFYAWYHEISGQGFIA